MSDPFGSAPEEMVNYQFPSEEEDPFRPIGKEVDGTFVPGKLECTGKCIALTPKKGPAGPMVVLTFVATEGEFASREFELYCSYSPKARFKLVETHQAMGLPEGPYPKSAAIGVYVTLCLGDEEYNGRWSAKLKSVKKHPKGAGYRGANALPGAAA